MKSVVSDAISAQDFELYLLDAKVEDLITMGDLLKVLIPKGIIFTRG